MDPLREFVGAVVRESRGPVAADRQASSVPEAGEAPATALTVRDGALTLRRFCLGFDALGDPEAPLG